MSIHIASSRMKETLCTLLAAAALALTSLGAYGALLPRDIDGDGIIDAYYDTALDITWLADWNASGQLLTWDQAVAWAASLNVHGVTGWRLPGITDTGNPGCDFNVAGGTDCGFNVDIKTSELARLWYLTLGNLAFCERGNPVCNLQGAGQPGWGLTYTGPFRNMQSASYWSGTEYAPNVSEAWSFATDDGGQDSAAKTSVLYAVAVHAGDVAPAPLTYRANPLNGFYAYGAGGGQQVGVSTFPALGHAMLWTRSAAGVNLHPAGFTRSVARGVAGRQQVGYAADSSNVQHAMLWKGSAASAVDLTPAGYTQAFAFGVDLTVQVGSGVIGANPSHALLWTGSASSAVDLHPVGFTSSQASGAGDGQQVGSGVSAMDGQTHALMWTGSAAGAVDLQPAGFTSSQASAAGNGQQVGSGVSAVSGHAHALLWTGSAAGAVDLHPAGFTNSQAKGVAGGLQVGVADGHAMLWSGSAGSAVALHNAPSSSAEGIDDAGNIVGWTQSTCSFCFPRAVLWVPVLPAYLSIIETASPDPIHAGDQITYSITVTNYHSGTVAGVSMSDSILLGTLVSATTDQGSCTGTGTVACDLGPLSNSAHITLVVQLPQAFPNMVVENGATVVAGDLLPISASVFTPVVQLPDLTASWFSAGQTCKARHSTTKCTIAGSLNVVNQGTATAGACVVRLYLSDDNGFSANDVLLGKANIPSLGAGAQHLMRVKLSLPSGGNASGKFLIAVIDADNVVTESSEANNVLATARFP